MVHADSGKAYEQGELLRQSVETTGDRTAGDVALGVVRYFAESLYGGLGVCRNTAGEVYISGLPDYGYGRGPKIGDAPMPDDLPGAVQSFADRKLHLPTSIETRVLAEPEQLPYSSIYRLAECSPGIMTREGLKRFVTGRGYDVHKLSGVLGDAFDVMCGAVDLVPPPRGNDGAAEEPAFVDMDVVLQTARIQGLGIDSRQRIALGLIRALRDQVETGQKPKNMKQEVVFSGGVDVYRVLTSDRFTEAVTGLRVAVGSLVALAETYPKRTGAVMPGRAFLENAPQYLQA